MGKIISSLVRLMSDFKVAFEKIVTIKQQIQPILTTSYIVIVYKVVREIVKNQFPSFMFDGLFFHDVYHYNDD